MGPVLPIMGSGGRSAVRDWLSFDEPGRVRLYSGKVELGQGVLTALAQLAASQLGVSHERVSVVSGDTRVCPNEGYTAASLSIELSGLAVVRATLSARRVFLDEVSRRLNVGSDSLTVLDGTVLHRGSPTGYDYWTLANIADLETDVDVKLDWSDRLPDDLVGQGVPRLDLPEKLTSGGFIHDVDLPDMLHARILRPPSFTARLTALDTAILSGGVDGVQFWRDGRFIGVVAETEYAAVRAVERAREVAVWEDSDSLPTVKPWAEYLQRQSSLDAETDTGAPLKNDREVVAVYSKPPIAHASMAPACGLARWSGGELTVWSSTQGVFNLRSALAEAFQIPVERVTVIHRPGAGCYGHSGAEDAAMDAALLARAFAPRPVRVQWTREDELAWAPYGSPMALRLSAGLTADARLARWSAEIWSGPHIGRPGFLPGWLDFAVSTHLEHPLSMSCPRKEPMAFVGADRNIEPPYRTPHLRIARHYLPDLPLRLSSLRTLGGFANVFASECFMDELADEAGLDPVEFRLRNLEDPRARRVIEAAAIKMSVSPAGKVGLRGHGLGYARYKNTAAYVAVIAQVEVEDGIRLLSLTGAVDAGLVINPDGVLNQIEGGAVQAASWTLREEVTFDSRMITSRTWQSYPILKFSETPALEFELIEAPLDPPLGVGEASLGPTAAAIGNAVARALGVRLRDLPITREQIITTLTASSINGGALATDL